MRLLGLFLAACGASSSPPPATEVHASRNVTDDVVESRGTEITRSHAQRITAAAIAWRRVHGGQCPSTRDVIEAYTFTAGTENDASGALLVLECAGPEIRVLSHGEVAYVERDEPSAVEASSISPAIAARLKACSDLALRQDRTASGVVHGDLVIAPDGMIKQVIVDSQRSTVDTPELLRCVQTKLKGVRSDVDTHGKETRVTF
jgi:hypothetical protein